MKKRLMAIVVAIACMAALNLVACGGGGTGNAGSAGAAGSSGSVNASEDGGAILPDAPRIDQLVNMDSAQAASVLEQYDSKLLDQYGDLSYEVFYPKGLLGQSASNTNYWELQVFKLNGTSHDMYGVTIDSMRSGFQIGGAQMNCFVKGEMPTCEAMAQELLPEFLDVKRVVLTRDSANGNMKGYFEGDSCGGTIEVRDVSYGSPEYEVIVKIDNMSRSMYWEEDINDAWKNYDSSKYYDSYKA